MKKFDSKNITTEIKLIAVISAISLLVMVLRVFNVEWYRTLLEELALFSDFKVFNFRIWQFFTYSFLHSGVVHLLLNMFMLYLFSQLFFTFFNEKQFLKAYFLGGIAAGVFYFLVSNLVGFQSFVIGASGAVMAVLFTVVGYRPNMRVQLIIFGNIAIYYVALAFLCFDLLQLFFDNAGGHLAHIGGSIFGFCYGKWLGGFSLKTVKKAKSKTHLRTIHKVNQTKNKIAENDIQKKIDSILDKISKSGYNSLTQDEKEFLFKQK
ncbi:rhomboid family intramembrane serine protease [Flavobacterium dauae]|uniref:rhomboid family protein n=1 Tax=Flavobacterium dauae TaxID=1563479 RepID=UPI00101B3DE4|nr:rhomboid family intramembrane serine protease [Flavobacterium dauae]WLD24555.1 rhomboid family intramembrane serine protease [Flavobacterium dauae]